MLRQLLKYKYLLIGLLIGFLYYSSYNYKDLQNEYAKILNISGKQRMLSQRLVILSKIYHVKRTSSLRKELEDTLLEIELAHKYLVKNTFTPELESIYFKQGLDKNIKTYLSNFYNLLKTNDENYITNARDNSKNILIQLDSAVKAYEKYINEQIKNIDIYKNMMIPGFLLTIFILLYFFMELRSRSKINTELSNELQKTIDIISEYVIYSKTDLKGVILEASDAFCSIAQYSREELIGKPHNIVRHPDIPSSIFKDMWKTIQSGETWKGEIKNLKKDGGYYWVTANITPEYDENGNIYGYMAIRYDITAKKELEELKENLNHQVIEEVEKNRIREKQLLQAEKMASMGEMIGNIAHQWRQPLNVISTVVNNIQLSYELNLKQSKQDTINDMLTISKTVKYLSNTIETFRNFIRGEKVYKEVIIQDEIKQALMIATTVLEDRLIQFKDNINYKDNIEAMLTTGELPQVIINIMNNAKDILVEKRIENPLVELNLLQEDNKVVITIEDNAGGIPEDIMPKIFEPYFTTKHKSQGTGLGLHMSYQIITDSLKGKLYAKNTAKGAKFFIEIPLTKRVKDRRVDDIDIESCKTIQYHHNTK